MSDGASVGRPRRYGEGYLHSDLTRRIITAAMAVHRELGPGFLEQVYENALCLEWGCRGHEVRRQVTCGIVYRGQLVGEHRLDLLVDDVVVVELKSISALSAVHVAQLRSTLRAAEKTIGLLLNFNEAVLRDGIKRVVLTGRASRQNRFISAPQRLSVSASQPLLARR